MYNTQVVCTYNTPEVFLETDNITDDEKAFVRDTIYRQELLDILDIDFENDDNDNDEKINNALNELYKRIKYCEQLTKCMLKLAGKYMATNEEFGLMLLFSYDYMYLTHICISEFIETGDIDNENITNLEKAIL
jgi:hypothetical protein